MNWLLIYSLNDNTNELNTDKIYETNCYKTSNKAWKYAMNKQLSPGNVAHNETDLYGNTVKMSCNLGQYRFHNQRNVRLHLQILTHLAFKNDT